MRMRDMNPGRKTEMLRSTGKNGQKRNFQDPSDVEKVNRGGTAMNENQWCIVA